MIQLPDEMTNGEAYGPAMEMHGEAEAREYFEALVLRSMRRFSQGREEAEAAIKSNLGYYAGYYDNETRSRVERLFLCAHPVFGPISVVGPPTAKEAFQKGLEAGRT